MATIPLRVYNREIEGLIETGKMDQAIAHCKHILKTFSMHIETYHLLGKAYLEAHRYADATDIFQRILNAVPDDFVSHVGMSIIRDDEGKVNDAIWHMERAYEVQPSNPAIQGELRRLYGKRDGIEPTKIRLSREALANMYAQGELYNQAIAEIRAILTDDPERPDLQVMLARAYFNTGQKVEAAEMATHLLKKYPYCVDALRVLVEVFPDSTNTENIEVYRQRLKLLDPYSPHITESAFHTEQVPDDAVTLEKFDYIADAQSNLGRTAWTSSLGIKLDTDDDHHIPTSLLQTPGQAGLESPLTPSTPDQAPEGEPKLEQPKTTGWEQPSAQTETPIGTGEEIPEQPAQAEIPDWLKDKAPTELSEIETKAVSTGEDETDLPDWLTSLGAEETPTVPAPVIHPGEQGPTSTTSPDMTGTTSGSDESPASASQLQTTLNTKDEKSEDEARDVQSWLEKLAERAGASSTVNFNNDEAQTTPQESQEPGGKVDETILNQEEGNTTSRIENDFPAMEGVISADDNNIASSPEDIGQMQESIPDKEKIEDIPDWIKTMTEEPAPVVSSDQAAEDHNLQDINQLAGIDEKANEQAVEATNIPEWLKHIDEERSLEPESNLPDVKSIDVPLEEEKQTQIPEDSNQKALESDMLEETKKNPSAAPEEDTSITEWLKKLDESAGSMSTPTTTQEIVPNQEEDLPAWLRDLEKDKAIPEPGKTPETMMGGMETPDWLKQRLEPITDQSTDTPGQPGIDIGMSEDEINVGKHTQPTIPTEWVPEENQVTSSPDETQLPNQTEKSTSLDANLKPESAPSNKPIAESDALILTNALDLSQANKFDEASKEYTKLIKKSKYLDEIIVALGKAVELFPDSAVLWQTLGDAYMRNNRLQNALDAYNKAEEFLR